MKRALLISFIIVTSFVIINTYSQNRVQSEYEEWKSSNEEYVNFDIGKYVTPNIVRNQLSVDFNLNSGYSHSNFDSKIYNDSSTSINYDFTGKITSNFSRYVNTRRKLSNLWIWLSFNENYTSQKTNQTLTSTSSNNANVLSENHLDVSWSNKWYFSKQFFLNYNINSGVDYDYTQNKIKNRSEDGIQKKNEYGFYVSPGLGIGYGRLEDVEDARHAVYIANALSKRNILARNLSNEELFELSQQISTVKNKRFLDSRLHLIDEISTVDSFFVKKELLSNNGVNYFTTLYDMWQYGALFPRKSGYEVYFLIYTNNTYHYMKNTPDLEEIIWYPHRAFLATALNLNYEKPFKLNWQHSVEVGSYVEFRQEKAGETDFNSIFSTDRKTFSAWTNYSLGYYPNTRTNIRATAGQQIWEQRYKIDINNSTRYTAIFNVGLDYYISPYFTVAGNFGLKGTSKISFLHFDFYKASKSVKTLRKITAK